MPRNAKRKAQASAPAAWPQNEPGLWRGCTPTSAALAPTAKQQPAPRAAEQEEKLYCWENKGPTQSLSPHNRRTRLGKPVVLSGGTIQPFSSRCCSFE